MYEFVLSGSTAISIILIIYMIYASAKWKLNKKNNHSKKAAIALIYTITALFII